MNEHQISSLETRDKQYEIYDKTFPAAGSFGVRINTSGKKSFFFIYKIAEKRKRVNLGSYPAISFTDAHALAKEYAKEIINGGDPAAEKNCWKRPDSFKELSKLFLKDLRKHGRKEKTLKEYERIFNSYLSHLDDRNVRSINQKEIEYFLSKKINKDTMRQRVQAALSSFFNFLINENAIRDSPLKNIIIKKENASIDEAKLLSLKETRAIWSATNKQSIQNKTIFRLLILSGQRPKDVLAMRWSDLRMNSWRLNYIDSVKQSPEEIPITPVMMEVLNELKNSGKSSKEFLFPSKNTNHVKHLQRACIKLNNDSNIKSKITPSIFRKNYFQLLLKQSIQPHVIESLLGQTRQKDFHIQTNQNEMTQALIKWSHAVIGLEILKQAKTRKNKAKVINLFDL